MTTKGKGVSFAENDILWHYRTPQGEEYDAALAELEAIAAMRDAFTRALMREAAKDRARCW